MGKVRLHDLMRRFGVGLDTLVDFLNNIGVFISDATPNTRISDAYIDELDSHFRDDAKVKDDSALVLRRHAAIRKTYSLPSSERSEILCALPDLVEEHLESTEGTETDRKLTRQEVFNVGYLSNINEISQIEDTLLSPLPSEKVSELRSRLDELYRERRRFERSMRRVESFLKTYPEYSSIADEIESRRAECRKAATARNEAIGRYVRPTAGEEYDQATAPVCLSISWSRIVFHDRKIVIRYNSDLELPVRCLKSRSSYNAVIRTFATKPPPLKVVIHGAGLSVSNADVLEGMLDLLDLQESLFAFRNSRDLSRVNVERIHKIPVGLFGMMHPLEESCYIRHLLDMQSGEFNYIPLRESHVSEPDGYLFTVIKEEDCKVIWESTSQSELRSTYVFEALVGESACLQQLLFDFAMSGKSGKRFDLRRRSTRKFFGFDYSFVKHDQFQSWKQRLDSTLSVKMSHHRQDDALSALYGTFVDSLRRSCIYSDVIPSHDGREVTATLPDGTRICCEFRNSSPGYRIRESLGWILGYAHYHAGSCPDRLYIVGTHRIGRDDYENVSLLRNLYRLNVWYMYFDLSEAVLHAPSASWE